MSVQKADGTANLRADPSVKSGSATASPSGGGKDMGGTENKRADHKVFDGKDKPEPTDYRHDVPDGLQNFDDNGQKAGGTKYLGR
jgi:hypothetical protein